MESPKNILSIPKPVYYDSVIAYAESPKVNFKDIRKAIPKNKEEIKLALEGLLNNCRFESCLPNIGYLRALGFEIEDENKK